MIIHLKDIQGVFTNADQEDIPDNFATSLQNLRPLHGKLVKTFGFGDLFSLDVLDIIETGYWVDTGHTWDDGQWWQDSGGSLTKSIGVSIINLVTYFNQNASAGSGYGSGDGYVFIGEVINASTCAVTLYYWTGVLWENITNLVQNTPDSFYHAYAKNPIVQQNEIIRLLPGGDGNVGSPLQEAIGIWLGYIDRDYFDKLYEHGTDYNTGFYQYPITPTRPDISSSGLNAVATVTAGGSWTEVNRYYKLSNVYDGVVESLLSEEIKVAFTASTFLLLTLTISTSTFNLRQTAINVYRSETGNIGDTAGQVDGSYEYVHTIELTRDPDNILGYSGTDAVGGIYNLYIPDLDDGIPLTYNYYLISSTTHYYLIVKPASANQKLFRIIDKRDSSDPTSIIGYEVDQDHNNGSWTFAYSNTCTAGSFTPYDTDTTGLYGGDLFTFLDSDTEFAADTLIYSVILVTISGTTSYRVITDNLKRCVRHGTAISGFVSGTGYDWQLLTVNSGLYYFTESGTTITCYFFDTALTEGAAYSLLNEPSIKVNSEFSVVHLGRLWQFNVILDPGGKNESHPDWLTYSEEDQYDVNPVSNSIKIADLTGGEGTGLATSFGSLILLKQNSIHKLIITDPSDDTTFILSESVFNRGCVAKKGWIQIGHKVYFCSSDGIYELDVNFQAAADDTPLIQNRISEEINDTYLALNDINEKPYISCGYDKNYTEIVFRFTSTAIWAFNILTKKWREIDTAKTCDIFAYDQYDDLMIFNESDDQLYGIGDTESVGSCVATKFFNISGYTGGREGLIRSVTIRYKSEVALLVRTYIDGSSSVNVGDEMAPALTQANWDTVAGWDLSATSLNHSSDGTGAITPLTSLSPIASDIYKCVITLSACTSGSCTYTLGGTAGSTLSSATTYTDYIIASNSNDLTFTPSAASARFTISSVSVKKVVGRSLAIASSITTVKLGIKARCHTFKIDIVDLTSSSSNTEIYDIKLEVE